MTAGAGNDAVMYHVIVGRYTYPKVGQQLFLPFGVLC